MGWKARTQGKRHKRNTWEEWIYIRFWRKREMSGNK